MKVDLKKLSEQLTSVEESTISLPEITPYVREHIYEALLESDTLLLTSLDFSKFDVDDIIALREHLEEKAAAKDRLEGINGIFCRADPVSVRMRSFC